MATSKRHSVCDRIKGQGLTPIFSSEDVEENRKVFECCARAGSEIFEFTARHPNALQAFKDLRRFASTQFPDVYLGVGTVKSQDQARSYMAAGAQFIVSPTLNEAVLLECAGKTPFIPGCFSPTELAYAHQHLPPEGIVKFFPAGVLGPEFVAQVKKVMPELNIMATGAIDISREGLGRWFQAGVAAVGVGSELIDKKKVAENKWGEIYNTILAALELASEFKGF